METDFGIANSFCVILVTFVNSSDFKSAVVHVHPFSIKNNATSNSSVAHAKVTAESSSEFVFISEEL